MTRSKDDSLFVAFIGLLLALPAAVWYGFAGQQLWGWFVVPLGLGPIGIWEAAGLATLMRLFTFDTRDFVEEDRDAFDKLAIAITKSAIAPAFALLFGFIYHLLAS